MRHQQLIDFDAPLWCIDKETGSEFPASWLHKLKNQEGSFVALWLMDAPVYEEPNADITSREFANVFDKYGNPLDETIDFHIRNV